MSPRSVYRARLCGARLSDLAAVAAAGFVFGFVVVL
jgi:hypothetical protein